MVLPSLRFFGAWALLLLLAPACPALEAKRLWEIEGLSQPRAASYDPQTRWIFISESSPTANGGREGWIAKADLSGRLTERRWLTGLEDPRGLCACGDSLFIADGKTVAVASISKGRVLARWKAPGAVGLESVAVSTTCAVYAADPGAGIVYKFSPKGRGKALARGSELREPAGLLFDGLSKRLVAASRGPADLKGGARKPGYLVAIGLADGLVRPLSGPTGWLAGLAHYEDGFLVADRTLGQVVRAGADGKSSVVAFWPPPGPGLIWVVPKRFLKPLLPPGGRKEFAGVVEFENEAGKRVRALANISPDKELKTQVNPPILLVPRPEVGRVGAFELLEKD